MCLQLLISLYVLLVPHQCPSTSAHALQVPDAIKSAFGCGDPQCIEKHGLWADGTLLPFLRSMLDRLGLPQAPLTGHDSVVGLTSVATRAYVAKPKTRKLLLRLCGSDSSISLTDIEWDGLMIDLPLVDTQVSAHSVAAGGNDVAVRKLLHLILKKLDGIQRRLLRPTAPRLHRAGRSLQTPAVDAGTDMHKLLQQTSRVVYDVAVPSLATALLPLDLCDSVFQRGRTTSPAAVLRELGIVVPQAFMQDGTSTSLRAESGEQLLLPAVAQLLKLNCPRMHTWMLLWERSFDGDEERGYAARLIEACFRRAASVAGASGTADAAVDAQLAAAERAVQQAAPDAAEVFPGLKQRRVSLSYTADAGQPAAVVVPVRTGSDVRCALDINADAAHAEDFCTKRADVHRTITPGIMVRSSSDNECCTDQPTLTYSPRV